MVEYGKVGLVLSGGGAKGAYQVGVAKALVEFGIPIHVMSGASIGALNGAVLASAPSFSVGAKRLEEIWLELATDSPLQHQLPKSHYIQLLLASGVRENLVVLLLQSLLSIAQGSGLSLPDEIHQRIHAGVMDDTPLKALLDKYIDHHSLSVGIPFYVSVFRSYGSLLDVVRVMAAELRLMESRNSEFIHLQSKSEWERHELLLASAAIPVAFAPRQVNGSMYSDGGQGGWTKAQGNTPISPLIDAGCDVVIVTHLSDGSLWSRHDFPDTTIVEIRPQSSVARDDGMLGGMKDLLGFDERKITSWIEQGYRDTQHCIGQIVQAGKARQHLKASERVRAESEANNVYADAVLSDALSRLT